MSQPNDSITLLSHDPSCPSFSSTRSSLRLLPYFDSLFDSSFADAGNRQFQIEQVRGSSHAVETLLFTEFLKHADDQHWLLGLRPRPKPRELIALCRLSSYYGADLSGQLTETLVDSWKTQSSHSPASLSSFLKCIQAMFKMDANSAEAAEKLQLRIYSDMMSFRHPALIVAHELPVDEQGGFWKSLLVFCSTPEMRERWPGLVIPYFRIQQSKPIRPSSSTAIVDEQLIQFLDESHFVHMKSHRESNGHQYGDFALHPASLIEGFSRVQLIWCWQNWSDSEGDVNHEEDQAPRRALMARMKRIWPSLLATADQPDAPLNSEELRQLAQDLGVSWVVAGRGGGTQSTPKQLGSGNFTRLHDSPGTK